MSKYPGDHLQLFNRIWQLKIAYHGKKAKIYQKLSPEDIGLHLTFQTEATMNGTPPSGDITIAGLPLDDIVFLSTNFSSIDNSILPSTVELQAGYEDTLSIILLGNIYQTTPNFSSSDYSISLKVMNGLEQNQLNAYSSISMKGRTTLRDICANLAKQLNKNLIIDTEVTNRAFHDFSFQGSPQELMNSLKTYYPDIQIYTDLTNLKVSTTTKRPQVRYKLTPLSGLIGSPQPTPLGCIITTLLLPNLTIGDHIELQNTKLPTLDGIYLIQAISHQGSSREQNYYTKLTLQKKQ